MSVINDGEAIHTIKDFQVGYTAFHCHVPHHTCRGEITMENAATLKTGLQFMEMGSRLVSDAFGGTARKQQNTAEIKNIMAIGDRILDRLLNALGKVDLSNDEHTHLLEGVLSANPFASRNPFSTLKNLPEVRRNAELFEKASALEKKSFEVNSLCEAFTQRLELLSEQETEAVLRDHPDILERVERYEREGSKGRPWCEIRAEERAKRGIA